MLAHRLRHSIKIQSPIESQDDDSGEIITIWQDIELSTGKSDMPAEVLTGGGKESYAENSKFSEVAARINIRWFPYPQQELYKCRIIWESQIMNIIDVQTDLTARQEWRFKCEAGVSVSGG